MTIVVPPGFWDFIQYVSEAAQAENDTPIPTKKSMDARRLDRVPIPKRTRKVSKYQKTFGKFLKMLKKKHPRTDISILMKRAHRMARRELK